MIIDKGRDHEVTVIGIVGGTGSGKTMMVRKIVEALSPNHVAVVLLGSYYNDTPETTEEERHAINSDRLGIFDRKLFIKQVNELHKGEPIEQPTYSYLRCDHLPETTRIEPRPVIIIEGTMTLLNKRLRRMMDLKVFVGCDPDERLIRNTQCDTIERGRDVDMVVQRYLDVLKPMYKQFIEPTKHFADVIIPQGEESLKDIDTLCKYVEHLVLTNLSWPINSAETCIEAV